MDLAQEGRETLTVRMWTKKKINKNHTDEENQTVSTFGSKIDTTPEEESLQLEAESLNRDSEILAHSRYHSLIHYAAAVECEWQMSGQRKGHDRPLLPL